MNSNINIPEYGVSQFNKAIKDIIEDHFSYVRIKGEKQIMFTVPQLKHPLVPKPEPVVMHFSRKKEKKKQKKK